jgi:hypothetical protein
MTSENELFINWLYIPNDDIIIDKIIDIANKFSIQLNVIFFKYALYLKNKGKSKDEIINELLKYNNLVDDDLYEKLYDNTKQEYLKYAYPIANIFLLETTNSNNIISNNKIHTNDCCVICLDEKPSILFNNCLHHITCLKCFQKILPKECTLCKDKINFILLF